MPGSKMREVELREVGPTDSPALAQLGEVAADGGRVAFATRYHVPVVEAVRAKHPDAKGVVAETADGRVVGAGWVSFDRCLLGGAVGEVALLHSLAVDPRWRRHGIAAALTGWRLQHASARNAVVLAAVQVGNTASEANARSWATQELGRLCVTPTSTRAKPPKENSTVTVRPPSADELHAVRAGITEFYADHLLSPAWDTNALTRWLDVVVGANALNHYLVAVDGGDRIVAGLGVEEEPLLSSLEVVAMPAALRLANRFLQVVPPDRRMRNLNIRMPWFAPGQLVAGQYLWESTRWSWRDRGSGLVTTVDPASQLSRMLAAPRWTPRTTLLIMARSARALPPNRPLAPVV